MSLISNLIDAPALTIETLLRLSEGVGAHHGALVDSLMEVEGMDRQEAVVLSTLVTRYYPEWAVPYFGGYALPSGWQEFTNAGTAYLAVCILT